VALRDNAFLVHVPRAQEPIRLAAYDARGRVVAVATDAMPGAPPQPVLKRPAHWRLVYRTPVVDGSHGELMLAPATHGGTCDAEMVKPGGSSSSGCRLPVHGKTLVVGWGGGNGVRLVDALVPPGIERLAVVFASGLRLDLPVVEGHVLGAYRKRDGDPVRVTGFAHDGRAVIHRRFEPPRKRIKRSP